MVTAILYLLELGKNAQYLLRERSDFQTMEEEQKVLISMPFRCRRRTIVHAPVCCLSTRTRLISPDQHLLKAPRHAALRQVLHLLHTTMSNCRSRDQALPTLRRRPRRPQSRLLRTAACPDGLVSYIYVWGRRSFSFGCILRAWTNHDT